MTTHMPMATTRQPFAPIQGSRLQNLTSLKNRQNALPTTLSSPTKRKATAFDQDDSENIDPIIFLSPKRAKAPDGSGKDTFTKPTNFFLTKAPPSPNDLSSPIKANPISSHRSILSARFPTPKVNTNSISKAKSTPAGRSPTRKHTGILHRHRKNTSSSFTRVDPPKFSTPSSSGLGFSIDAALSGSIPSYRQPQPASSTTSTPLPQAKLDIPVLYTPEPKSSWFFEIHEDTEEELATNLMEHSTCTLDISSDEESSARLKDERGKENVPPMDDISQTTSRIYSSSSSSLSNEMDARELEMAEMKARMRQNRRRKEIDENAIEIDRAPLGALAAEDFYAEGCDGESVFLVPSDPDSLEEEENENENGRDCEEPIPAFDFAVDVKGKGKAIDIGGDIEELMRRKSDDEAKLLQPIEQAEEGFEVWESGSAKGDE